MLPDSAYINREIPVNKRSRCAPRGNELVADALGMLAAAGFTPAIHGCKHLKITWFDHGRRYTLVVPVSPSDRRARLNSRATLRRLLRTSEGAP